MNAASPICVLLVEDEPFLALDLEQCFHARNAAVITVDRVAGALGTDLDDIDAAIIDVDLDGQDVWPVADRLRFAGKPYLIASGLGTRPQDIPIAHRDAPCLSKPLIARHVADTLIELVYTQQAADR